MKQGYFQAQHEQEWSALARWFDARARPQARDRASDDETSLRDTDFPLAYRRLCQQLALAERREYSPQLVQRLRALAERGHAILYRPRQPRAQRIIGFFAATFPRLVRAQWRAMAVAAVLFFVPLFAAIGVLQVRPELVHSVFSPEQIGQFEAMYDPAKTTQRLGREGEDDLRMFGYYVWNNVSIGFRTFASGLIACIGSVFVLVMNGVIIGGVAGHLTAIGYGDPFWRFVAGHSAPELLAIVISGGAGLQVGMALIAPGRRSRARALLEAGAIGARLVLGVFAMLVFAAFIEAFWSSIGWIPATTKYAVGAVLWAAIGLWLWRGGRGQDDAH